MALLLNLALAQDMQYITAETQTINTMEDRAMKAERKEIWIEVYKTEFDYLVYMDYTQVGDFEEENQWYEMNERTSPDGINTCVDVVLPVEFPLLWEGSDDILSGSGLPQGLIDNIKARL